MEEQIEIKRRGRRKGQTKNKFVGDGLRLCSLCKEARPIEDFSVDRSRSDGLSPRCSQCRKLSKKYVPCERCGGLRFGDTKGLCRACYTHGRLASVQPDVQWKVTWKDKPRTLQSILKPTPKKGKNCEHCGKWFTFKGNPKKRRTCSGECGLELGRELARSQSLLPYDFDLLYDLYWNQGLSTNQIAEKYGLANNGRAKGGANVHTRLRTVGVPTRRKGKHFERALCIIDGCDAPIYKILHKQNGYYGTRCLEHWVAHRQKLGSDYWFNIIKWRKLGLGESATQESLSEQIERLVPKSLPYEIRDEVCQEIALKVITREVAVEDLAAAVREHTRQFFNQYQNRFGALSLDAPLVEGESFTLGDTIV